jgi:nicotinate-nucleotide pyrophosphorylase (carboxylating)
MDRAAAALDDLVERALREDLGTVGDVTTRLCMVAPRRCLARIVAKASGVVAGQERARQAFLACDPEATVQIVRRDGERVAAGEVMTRIRGDAAAVLRAERTALNFLQRMSGIASLTRRFVDAVQGSGARILETRKTTPTLRALEKEAVRIGGGVNHRMGLFDQVLLKENHFACAAPLGYRAVVERVVAANPTGQAVVAEARTVNEAVDAVLGGAGIVLLDNFEPGADLERAVTAVREAGRRVARPVAVEVSGGIRLDNVAAFAACGVDRISVGALTHSAPALDLSLLVEELT